MKAVNSAVQDFIQQSRQRLLVEPNLLEAMLAAADQPDSGIDDVQVTANVLTLRQLTALDFVETCAVEAMRSKTGGADLGLSGLA